MKRRVLEGAALLFLLAIFHSPLTVAQNGPLDPTPVIEYYNSDLDHYFLSTPSEAAQIDAGSAGPGWSQTGRVFYVESRAYVFYGTWVCRFYGSVSPGPNSHFFTIDPSECSYLKYLQSITPDTEKRWNFEGYFWPAGVPQAGGTCGPIYSVPVYRFYNKGFERGIDSNHRYVTRQSDVNEMVGKGWKYEGVAFCALSALN